MPKLHSANTVAWGLLKGARCGMMVVRHWSKPAWQNMTSLLMVVGLCTPHNMPYGGKSLHLIFNKPPLVSRPPPPRPSFEGEVFHKVLRMHTFVTKTPSLLSPASSCRLRQGHG